MESRNRVGSRKLLTCSSYPCKRGEGRGQSPGQAAAGARNRTQTLCCGSFALYCHLSIHCSSWALEGQWLWRFIMMKALSQFGGTWEMIHRVRITLVIVTNMTYLVFIRGTWHPAPWKPAAGACVVATESDQKMSNVFRAYFHLISGHWMNCPWSHVLLFRIWLSESEQPLSWHPGDLLLFTYICTVSLFLMAGQPCLGLGPETAAVLFPESGFLSLAPQQAIFWPKWSWCPALHVYWNIPRIEATFFPLF